MMNQHSILLIDPFKNLLNAYRMILEEEKYLVETAVDINDTYLLFEKSPYSAILVEYIPPLENFQKVIQWVKEKVPEIYILMVTHESVDDQTYEKLFDIGIDDFILKPYSPQKIILHLKRGLRQREENSRMKAFERLTLLDPLSRNRDEPIFNKTFLKRCLRQELKKARRHKHAFSILLIRIPDRGGGGERYDHVYGELVRMIRKFIREEDLLVKNNGEIALLLPDTNQMGSQSLVWRLSHLVKNHPSLISDDLLREITQTSSFQAFSYPDHFDLPEPIRTVIEEMQKEYPYQ